MEPHKIPFLYNFSPTVVPPPLDWPEWIRVTGYWFLDDADVSAKKWTPPDALVEFIDNAHAQGKKVVYIGFGSIVVSDPKTMTRCVIEAVVQSGVYAILSKGWSDRLHVKVNDAAEPEEPLPPQIYPISSVPHDWLFKRIDAACHHGGAGTTGASLRGMLNGASLLKCLLIQEHSWYSNHHQTVLWRPILLGRQGRSLGCW
jgi:sterol 3beta-glucosyltransferase